MSSTYGVEAPPWRSVQAGNLPDEGVIVETKIDDWRGVRNVATLKRRGHLWFHPDDSMYVYYTPTHWRRRSAWH